MKSAHPRIRFLAITLFITSVALRASAADNKSSIQRQVEPAIVATVEGQPIQAKIYRMYVKNGIEALGLSDKTDEGRKKIEQLKQDILSEMIDRALIEAEARRRNLTISDEQFIVEYNRRISEMGGEQLYQDYLKDSGITDDDFRRIVRQEIYGELLRKEFEKTIRVSEAEARAFYNKERANPKYDTVFVEPERVRASHILISARRTLIANELRARGITDKTELDRAIVAEVAKRRERAVQLLAKVKAGADFAVLARENSDDAGTRERGGDLGLFTRSTHTARFDDVAFAIKPGQVSDIVETDYGFHIIKVTEHRARRARAFGEVRSAIEQHLSARKLAQQLTNWLEARRRAADVQIAPAYRAAQIQTRSQ
ncbi:MAG TPA: peptidylprolyl isomerase [Blastocatellia bacterium]|nr:peptidylprolyl isomerase [Blastocatellia bacterium]